MVDESVRLRVSQEGASTAARQVNTAFKDVTRQIAALDRQFVQLAKNDDFKGLEKIARQRSALTRTARSLEKVAKAASDIQNTATQGSPFQNLLAGAESLDTRQNALIGGAGRLGAALRAAWPLALIAGAAAAIGAVTVAAVRLTKSAIEAGKSLVNLGVRATTANNQLKVFRARGNDLQALRDATDGIIDDATLIKTTNLGNAFGIAGEQLAQFTRGATAFAQASGEKVGFLLQSLVSGVSRVSKPILDNASIVLSSAKAFEQYAADTGKAADSLTEFEKKQAVATFVAGKADEIYQAVSRSGAELVTSVQQVTVAAQNAAGAFEILVGSGVESFLDTAGLSFGNLAGRIEALSPEVTAVANALGRFANLQFNTTGIDNIVKSLETLVNFGRRTTRFFSGLKSAFDLLILPITAFNQVLLTGIDAIDIFFKAFFGDIDGIEQRLQGFSSRISSFGSDIVDDLGSVVVDPIGAIFGNADTSAVTEVVSDIQREADSIRLSDSVAKSITDDFKKAADSGVKILRDSFAQANSAGNDELAKSSSAALQQLAAFKDLAAGVDIGQNGSFQKVREEAERLNDELGDTPAALRTIEAVLNAQENFLLGNISRTDFQSILSGLPQVAREEGGKSGEELRRAFENKMRGVVDDAKNIVSEFNRVFIDGVSNPEITLSSTDFDVSAAVQSLSEIEVFGADVIDQLERQLAQIPARFRNQREQVEEEIAKMRALLDSTSRDLTRITDNGPARLALQTVDAVLSDTQQSLDDIASTLANTTANAVDMGLQAVLDEAGERLGRAAQAGIAAADERVSIFAQQEASLAQQIASSELDSNSRILADLEARRVEAAKNRDAAAKEAASLQSRVDAQEKALATKRLAAERVVFGLSEQRLSLEAASANSITEASEALAKAQEDAAALIRSGDFDGAQDALKAARDGIAESLKKTSEEIDKANRLIASGTLPPAAAARARAQVTSGERTESGLNALLDDADNAISNSNALDNGITAALSIFGEKLPGLVSQGADGISVSDITSAIAPALNALGTAIGIPILGDLVSLVVQQIEKTVLAIFTVAKSSFDRVAQSFDQLFSANVILANITASFERASQTSADVRSFFVAFGFLGSVAGELITPLAGITDGLLSYSAALISSTESFAKFEDGLELVAENALKQLDPIFDQIGPPLLGIAVILSEAFASVIASIAGAPGLLDLFVESVRVGSAVLTFGLGQALTALAFFGDTISAQAEVQILVVRTLLDVVDGLAEVLGALGLDDVANRISNTVSVIDSALDAFQSLPDSLREAGNSLISASNDLLETNAAGLASIGDEIRKEIEAREKLNESLSNLPQFFVDFGLRQNALDTVNGGGPSGGDGGTFVPPRFGGITIDTQIINANLNVPDGTTFQDLITEVANGPNPGIVARGFNGEVDVG